MASLFFLYHCINLVIIDTSMVLETGTHSTLVNDRLLVVRIGLDIKKNEIKKKTDLSGILFLFSLHMYFCTKSTFTIYMQ